MKSRLVPVAVALAATLATPAFADAAGTVSGGPAKVAGGYQLIVSATDARKDTFTILLTKVTAKAKRTEEQIFAFDRGVKVRVKGGSASVKGSLGRWGRVDLRLGDSRATKRKRLPKGCTGTTGTTRLGTLRGKLRFRMPNGKFVTLRSLSAQTYVGGKLDCTKRGAPGKGDGDGGDGDGAGGEPTLMLSKRDGGATFTFTARKSSLFAIASEDPEATKPARVSRSVSARGTNLLVVSGGGASAHVKSAGAFTGDGSFTAAVASGQFATGTLAGSLGVRIPGAGTVALVGDDAILMNGAG